MMKTTKKILVVEDEEQTREFYRTFIEWKLGYQVVAVETAEKAWKEATSNQFDLFFVDINLPGKSGLDLVSELRNREITTPAIAVSGLPEKEDIIRATKLGFSSFLGKPTSLNLIKNSVELALDGKREFVYTETSSDETQQRYLCPYDADGKIVFFEIASFKEISNGDENERQALCLSTQSGCLMGCRFCATGSEAKSNVRNLTFEVMQSRIPIVEAYHGFQKGHVHVNLAGMGEPTFNVEDVARLIESADNRHSFRISTVGLILPLKIFIRRIGGNPKLKLIQISLHFPNDGLRQAHMPIAKNNSIKDLIEVAEEAAKKTEVCFNYALFRGINDSPEHIRELISLVENRPFSLRLSQANEYGIYAPIDQAKLASIESEIDKHNIKRKKYFHSLGDGVDGMYIGCGQMAARINRRSYRKLEGRHQLMAI